MVVWRLARQRYADLSGAGGLVTPGRWHPRGFRALYTSANVPLAVLEVRVHTPRRPPVDLVLMEIEMPNDSVTEVAANQLPLDWRRDQAFTQRIGSDWLERAGTLALKVPSAVVPECFNFVINPQHARARELALKSVTAFEFDARLYH